MKILKKVSQTAKEAERAMNERIEKHRRTVFERYPLLFTFLVSFGAVATFYGLQEIISSVDILADHPTLILFLGISTLWFTGKLYEKLK
ncbi:TPA: hypothetical protein EYO12_03275 [Candidatus Saccharibacteria bacterium]|nr:hypothetical protein [Candidatus Saccharibacteria bacterium]HIO87945.1 hypothetical protein [Candidatus Saccharibacteria bacterium]